MWYTGESGVEGRTGVLLVRPVALVSAILAVVAVVSAARFI